jgi:hypothetical protein
MGGYTASQPVSMGGYMASQPVSMGGYTASQPVSMGGYTASQPVSMGTRRHSLYQWVHGVTACINVNILKSPRTLNAVVICKCYSIY